MNTNTEEFVWYCWIRAYNALKGKRRTNNKWATTWQNRQNECTPTQRRLRLAWASTQSDQSLRCPHEECLVLSYPLRAVRRLWSDWVDAQADLSLRWAHTHFVGFVMSRLKLNFILSRCAKTGSSFNFVSVKETFKKCNPSDFKFYLSKLTYKKSPYGVMLNLLRCLYNCLMQ